jgi:serine/threonine protein kinase
LGPHCALVENIAGQKVSCRRQNGFCFAAQLDCANPFFLNHQEVYRAYDSRPWPIARNSSVYDSKIFITPTTIYEAADDEQADAASQDKYRIFNFRGKLKVIAIPFIEGSHIPQNKDQLLGVANFLKKMHDTGFVHGDIRLLNIVFTEKPEDS